MPQVMTVSPVIRLPFAGGFIEGRGSLSTLEKQGRKNNGGKEQEEKPCPLVSSKPTTLSWSGGRWADGECHVHQSVCTATVAGTKRKNRDSAFARSFPPGAIVADVNKAETLPTLQTPLATLVDDGDDHKYDNDDAGDAEPTQRRAAAIAIVSPLAAVTKPEVPSESSSTISSSTP
ncbi:hypothetical protein MKZ38_002743 [Zalerion maritima]|uniref:Uncharacterized protein n=1 Tax=Zalerion maritima TaxID=339359 RepID=A0AAD5RQ51_9PEZI|nr:hypothetical protein MKZ38_002743 [Zalerion maritima]